MNRVGLACGLLLWALPAHADDVLHAGTPVLDPPTVIALGVSVPITGDDNFNATISMRYRVAGTTAWHDALPLQHVHAEAVTGFAVTPQFAGSIFDLAPDTAYEIELHAIDPDGAVDQTLSVSGHTRALPRDPAAPHAVSVSTAAQLTSALAAAQPGDVIELAPGTYTGTFALQASGTADNPIVIRGAADGAILDGGGCSGCNVLEVYGSFVHVEALAIQHATRALRFQTAGTQANVVRRVHVRDVVLAIGSQPDQKDFYIADNVLEGRLVWPCVYTSDDPACNAGGQHGLHANDDGIHVEGTGHVIAHNTIAGFGDAMKTEQDGAISIDFYGNDVLWTYDNGIELDGSARNTRAWRNRFTNTFATLSFQPIYGGPAYAFRNVLVNVADEQFKLHSLGTTPTVGAVILHNTVVRALRAVQCSTGVSPAYFTVEDNLFVGPPAIADGHTVRWDVPDVSTATIDHNGYFPDGQFEFGYGPSGVTYASMAETIAGGRFDTHSRVFGTGGPLAGGEVGFADYQTAVAPTIPIPEAVGAIDGAAPLPNISDVFAGSGPDLGAIEAGCAMPRYGVRPAGEDETNEVTGCVPGGGSGGDAGAGGDAGGSGGEHSGCGCRSSGGGGALPFALIALSAARRSRSRRRARGSRTAS